MTGGLGEDMNILRRSDGSHARVNGLLTPVADQMV